MTALLLIALLGAAEAVSAPAQGPVAPPNAPAPAAPSVDVYSDTPPPSAWQRAQVGEKEGPVAPPDAPSLAFELVRAVVSLGLVVALIYALGKLVLAKMGRFSGVSAGSLAISERLQVDAKNALFVVTVDGKERLLVGGGGDRGLRLLATLPPTPSATQGQGAGTFRDALDKAADDKEGST